MSIVAKRLYVSGYHLVQTYSLTLGDIVLDGYPGPPPSKGAQPLPLFSVHAYCGHGGPSQLELLLRILKPEVTNSQSMDHATRLITIGRIYYSTAMRPGSNKPLLLGRFTVLRT